MLSPVIAAVDGDSAVASPRAAALSAGASTSGLAALLLRTPARPSPGSAERRAGAASGLSGAHWGRKGGRKGSARGAGGIRHCLSYYSLFSIVSPTPQPLPRAAPCHPAAAMLVRPSQAAPPPRHPPTAPPPRPPRATPPRSPRLRHLALRASSSGMRPLRPHVCRLSGCCSGYVCEVVSHSHNATANSDDEVSSSCPELSRTQKWHVTNIHCVPIPPPLPPSSTLLLHNLNQPRARGTKPHRHPCGYRRRCASTSG